MESLRPQSVLLKSEVGGQALPCLAPVCLLPKWAPTADADHLGGNGHVAVCTGRRLDELLAGWLFLYTSVHVYLLFKQMECFDQPKRKLCIVESEALAWPLW